MKIAICDDEREFLENVGLAIETYLNEKGLEYNIDLYNSGKVIMELRENIVSYDVVFLDINMPEVSGLEASIYECMDAVLYNMNYRGIDKRVFICNHKEKEVIINKVMYIESSAHKVMFHIDGKESDDYVTNNKLNDIEKTLKDCEYMIRVHQSYMVNMMYVKKVSGYRIYLKNGEEIGVPKPRYKEVKKTIMEFKAII